jgi:hypothetical protein
LHGLSLPRAASPRLAIACGAVACIRQDEIEADVLHIDAIERAIGFVVMVLDPWDKPLCLTRVWCAHRAWGDRPRPVAAAIARPPTIPIRLAAPRHRLRRSSALSGRFEQSERLNALAQAASAAQAQGDQNDQLSLRTQSGVHEYNGLRSRTPPTPAMAVAPGPAAARAQSGGTFEYRGREQRLARPTPVSTRSRPAMDASPARGGLGLARARARDDGV